MHISDFVARMLDPHHVLTHVPYALLVISMMMNDMGWLRAIAISAGVIRIINRAFFEIDPIIVFWEVIFVAVNVAHLFVLWHYARRHRFSADEQQFVAAMPRGIDRRTIRRLLRLAQTRRMAPGDRLTSEGAPVADLLFLAEGVVQIEQNGRIVAVCGPGDFIGELSFVTGAAASATAIAARPVRVFAFDQQRLRAAIATDGDLRAAVNGSVNHNLAGKLARTTTAPLARA